MKLSVTTCYSHLLYMQMQGPLFQQAVSSVIFTSPRFDHEGLAGYIETTITFEIHDLKVFTKLYTDWYTYADGDKVYNCALGRGCQ